jgi:membrane-associated phospholipid phosphatase
MREKDIILVARILSAIFSPFYLPVVGLLALFFFSYLSLLTWPVKLYIFIIVFTLTILLPTTLIRIYRKYQGWNLTEIAPKERRMIPYVISILCYFFCYYILNANHIPYTIGSIVVASLMIQVVCAMINIRWKISVHSAAIGGVTGAIVAFALIFNFNPVWWLCLVLLLAGLVGSSRIILRQHTLGQVVTGFFVGMVCAIISILFI